MVRLCAIKLILYIVLITLVAATTGASIHVQDIKRQHVLTVGYHALPHDESYTAKCRYHSRESESLRGDIAVGSKEHKAGRRRKVEEDPNNCEEEDASSSSNQIKLRDKMRFDHAWQIFVGWVDNAKSDSEFLVDIGIGTPNQNFLASIDTGSPLTWVYSQECCFQSNHSYFKPQESSSYSIRMLDTSTGRPVAAGKSTPDNEAQRFIMEYGKKNTSSLSMKLAFETITVFPNAVDSLQVTNQTIGLVTSIAGAQRGQGRDLRRNDALLGLSPGNGTKVPGKLLTPIEQLIKDDLIAQPIFTVTFVKAIEPLKSGEGGRLIIGGLDEDRTIGDITWINSTSSVFWGFEFDEGAMRYNSKDIWLGKNKRRAIVDTGSSAIYLPKAAAQATNEQIFGSLFDNNASRWLIPCKTGHPHYEQTLAIQAQTKLFTINIADRTFGLPLQDIVLFPLVPVSTISSEGKEDYCNSAIQIGSEDFAVLGNAFIKNHAISFDYGGKDLTNRRIGIANRKDTGIIVDLEGVVAAVGSMLHPIDIFPSLQG